MAPSTTEDRQATTAPPLVFVNIGRDKTTASVVGNAGQAEPKLVNGRDGLNARYAVTDGASRNERITDRLIRFIDSDQVDEAIAMTADLAGQILADLPDRPFVVLGLPAAFGPQCEAAVVDGFELCANVATVVRRPVPLLSACHGLDTGPMLAIDNDSGELAIAAFDGASKRVFPPAPLSTGPTDEPERVIRRLRSYVRDVAGHLPTNELVVDDSWETISAQFRTIVLGGPGATNPAFRALIGAQFGPTTLIVTDESRPADTIHQLAPLHQSWSAGWPTARPAIADGILRLLGTNDEPYQLRIGSQITTGLKVPADLTSNTRLRPLPDGRLLILGQKGTRPLTMRVGWSLTSGAPTEVLVEPIGTRPLQLIEPRAAQPHRAKALS